METIQELAEGRTKQTNVTGTSFTAYPLTPVLFLKEVIDAAKQRWYFAQFAYTAKLNEGQKDLSLPKRSLYLGSGGITAATSEPTAGSPITSTTIDNLDGVVFTPAMIGYRVSISNHALRTNALDLIGAAREELIYGIGDRVDQAVVTALKASTNQADSDERGASIVYGGDARADSELAAGDTLTTDMIAAARRKLMSTTQKYWTPASPAAEATSSAAKNPWANEPAEPFVLFIRPEQEEILLTDSQFINAAEYGSNEVVMNGEIGRYIGIKIIVTNNVPSVAASGTAFDGGSTTAVAISRCMMLKARKAMGLVWGIEPTIKTWDNVIELAQEIVLETAYQAKVIHSDAICYLDVADA